jgi:hypothetical protein
MPSESGTVARLEELAQLLSSGGESHLADLVNAAISGTESERSAFLVSNELWGGAGSIADQAGVAANRSDERRRIERVLIAIGEEQMRSSNVNQRTEMWVSAFKQWARDGI